MLMVVLPIKIMLQDYIYIRDRNTRELIYEEKQNVNGYFQLKLRKYIRLRYKLSN